MHFFEYWVIICKYYSPNFTRDGSVMTTIFFDNLDFLHSRLHELNFMNGVMFAVYMLSRRYLSNGISRESCINFAWLIKYNKGSNGNAIFNHLNVVVGNIFLHTIFFLTHWCSSLWEDDENVREWVEKCEGLHVGSVHDFRVREVNTDDDTGIGLNKHINTWVVIIKYEKYLFKCPFCRLCVSEIKSNHDNIVSSFIVRSSGFAGSNFCIESRLKNK